MAEVKNITINDWFRRAGDVEAETDITIGTRGSRSIPALLATAGSLRMVALGKLVELKRREAGLTIENLASAANLTVRDIVQLERGLDDTVNNDWLASVAGVLQLPPNLAKMLTMSGPIQEAAVRFTTQISQSDELKPSERIALSEFVSALEQAG
jgi:transcriptional regulator with XRE-family HTH domain